MPESFYYIIPIYILWLIRGIYKYLIGNIEFNDKMTIEIAKRITVKSIFIKLTNLSLFAWVIVGYKYSVESLYFWYFLMLVILKMAVIYSASLLLALKVVGVVKKTGFTISTKKLRPVTITTSVCQIALLTFIYYFHLIYK